MMGFTKHADISKSEAQVLKPEDVKLPVVPSGSKQPKK